MSIEIIFPNGPYVELTEAIVDCREIIYAEALPENTLQIGFRELGSKQFHEPETLESLEVIKQKMLSCKFAWGSDEPIKEETNE